MFSTSSSLSLGPRAAHRGSAHSLGQLLVHEGGPFRWVYEERDIGQAAMSSPARVNDRERLASASPFSWPNAPHGSAMAAARPSECPSDMVASERSERLNRVALVIGQLGRGGTERQLVLLAAGLRDRGVHVEVAALFGGGPLEDELDQLGVDVFRPRFPPRSMANPLLLASAVVRFGMWLRRVRPQVVHAFLLESYLLTAPVARLVRVPVVVAGRRSLGDFKEHHRVALVLERVANKMTDLIIAVMPPWPRTRRRKGSIRPQVAGYLQRVSH